MGAMAYCVDPILYLLADRTQNFLNVVAPNLCMCTKIFVRISCGLPE